MVNSLLFQLTYLRNCANTVPFTAVKAWRTGFQTNSDFILFTLCLEYSKHSSLLWGLYERQISREIYWSSKPHLHSEWYSWNVKRMCCKKRLQTLRAHNSHFELVLLNAFLHDLLCRLFKQNQVGKLDGHPHMFWSLPRMSPLPEEQTVT